MDTKILMYLRNIERGLGLVLLLVGFVAVVSTLTLILLLVGAHPAKADPPETYIDCPWECPEGQCGDIFPPNMDKDS